jgi:hypothetical protein
MTYRSFYFFPFFHGSLAANQVLMNQRLLEVTARGGKGAATARPMVCYGSEFLSWAVILVTARVAISSAMDRAPVSLTLASLTPSSSP